MPGLSGIGKVAACAVAAGFLASASASALTIDGTNGAISPRNDFLAEMSDAFGGSSNLGFMTGVSLTTRNAAAASFTFTEVGAESGFRNSFSDGVATLGESGNFGYGTDFLTDGGASFGTSFAGLVTSLQFSSNKGVLSALGSSGFGIFFDKSVQNGNHSVLFLAYDDHGGLGDGDYDDYIVRLNIDYNQYLPPAVPLPAGLWLMGSALAGLGFAGRRRQRNA